MTICLAVGRATKAQCVFKQYRWKCFTDIIILFISNHSVATFSGPILLPILLLLYLVSIRGLALSKYRTNTSLRHLASCLPSVVKMGWEDSSRAITFMLNKLERNWKKSLGNTRNRYKSWMRELRERRLI